jgi:hypothetical protein
MDPATLYTTYDVAERFVGNRPERLIRVDNLRIRLPWGDRPLDQI